jgi:chromosome segregation ATPase
MTGMTSSQREAQAILSLVEGFKAIQQQLADANAELQQAKERITHLESMRVAILEPHIEVQEAIKRCISKVALMGVSHWENEDISWACDFIIKDIKEHYGMQ